MARKLLALFTIMAVLLVAAVTSAAAAGYMVYHAVQSRIESRDFGTIGFGSLGVEVVDRSADGFRFGIRLPAFLVNTALAVAPLEIPEEATSEMRRHLPLMRALADGLAECPDGVFVQVKTKDETVVVAKRGGVFRVDVDTPDAEVHVTMPVSSVTTVLTMLDSVASHG